VRVLYLHQFFMTRDGSGGTRSYEFARRLAADGDAVTMVTSGPGGEREVDGIRVVEARGGYGDYMRATKVGYGRRLLAFGRFALAATAATLRGPRPDVVFATSPPLTMALPAIVAARRWRVPLVFEVRDLWPEAPIQMGALSAPWMQRLARWLERAVYRSASEVVALSPGMRDGIVAAGTDSARVTLIPNASDLDLFSPDLDPGDLRERLGIDGGDFLCAYFGTMGEANDLTQVVEAAALLDAREAQVGAGGAAAPATARRIVFVLQGEGKRRPELEADVRRRGLGNVLFAPAGDKLAAARLAAASDACMTIFKDVPILATNSPNKLFDTFAAGRPAIVNTDGWQRVLVEEHAAGVFARPGDAADLADAVSGLAADPERARAYGVNARALAEREFGRDLLAARLRRVLERAVAERTAA
jgi:glycosyltransferase involved in cell wall biosynthesis